MEFIIRKNATLPLLKMQIVKDGKGTYEDFMSFIETSTIYFSMQNTENGGLKINTSFAGFVEKIFDDPNAAPEYYLYYRFTKQNTSKPGRYEGQFVIKNDAGTLVLPIREKLNILIKDSLLDDDLDYNECFVGKYECCIIGPPSFTTPTPTRTPTPTISITPSVTKTQTPTLTVSPSITPTGTLTPTPTMTYTPTETPTPTITTSTTPSMTPTSQPCDCLRMSAATEAESYFEMTLSQNGTLNGKPFFEGISPTAEQLIVLYFNSTNSRWEALLNGNFYFDYLNSTSDCPISTNWISEFGVLTIYFTEGILCPTLTPTPTNTQTPTPTPSA
jgi:hypothetical protein